MKLISGIDSSNQTNEEENKRKPAKKENEPEIEGLSTRFQDESSMDGNMAMSVGNLALKKTCSKSEFSSKNSDYFFSNSLTLIEEDPKKKDFQLMFNEHNQRATKKYDLDAEGKLDKGMNRKFFRFEIAVGLT